MKVIYRIITEADKDAVIECLMETFHSRESLTIALGVTKEELRLYSQFLCEKAIREQLSLVAVNADTNELLGYIICEDLRSEPVNQEKILENPKFRISFALLTELMQPLQTAEYPQGPKVFFHGIISTVHKHVARQGIFKRLLIESCKLAHEQGFQYRVGAYTSPYSYQTMLAYNQGCGRDVNVIHYRDFMYEGKKVFPESTGKAILHITDLPKLIQNLIQNNHVQTIKEARLITAEWVTLLNRLRNNDASLTKLDLRLKQLDDDAVKELAIALENNRTLLELDLGGNQITDAGVAVLAAMLKDNHTIRVLDLGQNQISDNGVMALVTVFQNNCKLTRLSLRYNKISNAGVIALATIIKNNQTLVSLNLRNNEIGEKGAVALAEALKANSTLTSLYLGWNLIGETGAIELALAVKNNCVLKVLNLEHNQIGDVGAKALATVIEVNCSLRMLNLGANDIGDPGATALASALTNNQTLETLELGWNQIGDLGMEKLALALKNNHGLIALYLSSNKISVAGIRALEGALKINCTLKALYLGGNQIADSTCKCNRHL